MSESRESGMSCPRCGTTMIAGHLKDPADVILIESLHSLESSSLQAWICPECGHVELEAADPEDLARHDISAEDLGINQEDRKDWADWENDL